MQDEARHVMFGRLALRDYYPQLTQKPSATSARSSASTPATACGIGSSAKRCGGPSGLPDEVATYVNKSELQRTFRGFLFMRIVPILKDIGLWGDKIQKAFADMGVLGFADADIDAAMAEDEEAAVELDQLRMAHIESVAAEGSS